MSEPAPGDARRHAEAVYRGLPAMSGKELAERPLLVRPSLKVLFVSGYSGDAIIQGMLGPGVDFIQKPFASRELLSKIREILGRP
jgi:two-component system cell cycle sensor histidine kinase/response regulator CckA